MISSVFEKVTHKCLVKLTLASTQLTPEVSDTAPLLKAKQGWVTTCMKYSSSALCSQILNCTSKNSHLQEMLKFCTKWLLFHLTGSESTPGPLLHLSYFQLKFVGSAQVCRFSFQRCRTLLGVGDQHIDYHHAALTFHYSNPSLSWALQMEQK